jgi:hypothetical protein
MLSFVVFLFDDAVFGVLVFPPLGGVGALVDVLDAPNCVVVGTNVTVGVGICPRTLGAKLAKETAQGLAAAGLLPKCGQPEACVSKGSSLDSTWIEPP